MRNNVSENSKTASTFFLKTKCEKFVPILARASTSVGIPPGCREPTTPPKLGNRKEQIGKSK